MTSRPQLPDHPFTRPVSRRPTGGRAGGRLEREATSPPRAESRGPVGGALRAVAPRGRRAVAFLLVAAGALLSAGSVRAADGDVDPSFRSTGSYVYGTPISGAGVALAFRADGVPLAGYTVKLSGTDTDMRVVPVPDQGIVTHCASYHPDLGGTDADVLTDLAVDGDRVYLAGRAAGPPEDPKNRGAIAAFQLDTCSLESSFGGNNGAIIDSASTVDSAALELASNGAPRLALARDPGLATGDLLTYGLYSTNGAIDAGFTTASVDFSSSERPPSSRGVATGNPTASCSSWAWFPSPATPPTSVSSASTPMGRSTTPSAATACSLSPTTSSTRATTRATRSPCCRIAGSWSRARSCATPGPKWRSPSSTPTGGYDNGFGVVGRYSFRFSDSGLDQRAVALAVQGDGRILVGGQVSFALASDRDFGIARLLASGDEPLDPSFSGDGRRTLAFDLAGSGEDVLTALALDPTGRIVVAGPIYDGDSAFSLGIVRLQNGYIFADGFEWGNTAAW